VGGASDENYLNICPSFSLHRFVNQPNSLYEVYVNLFNRNVIVIGLYISFSHEMHSFVFYVYTVTIKEYQYFIIKCLHNVE
jgi:hypothetical protein